MSIEDDIFKTVPDESIKNIITSESLVVICELADSDLDSYILEDTTELDED